MILTLVMCFSLSGIAYADDNTKEVSARTDTLHYYVMKNNQYQFTEKSILAYLTEYWAKSNLYRVDRSQTKTSSLAVSGTSGVFNLANVKATGQYTKTYSTSFSVGTNIPADSTRNSKLTIQEEKRVYTGDLYYVIDYGTSKSESKQGSGLVYEPKDLYLEVIYQ